MELSNSGFESPQKDFVLTVHPSAVCYKDKDEDFHIYNKLIENPDAECIAEAENEEDAWDTAAAELGFYTQFLPEEDEFEEEDELEEDEEVI